MPVSRHAALSALAAGEALSTAAVAPTAGLHRHVARRMLKELDAIGVVTNDRVADEDDELVGPVTWHLAGDVGALIAGAFRAREEEKGGGTKRGNPTPHPPQRETGLGHSRQIPRDLY